MSSSEEGAAWPHPTRLPKTGMRRTCPESSRQLPKSPISSVSPSSSGKDFSPFGAHRLQTCHCAKHRSKNSPYRQRRWCNGNREMNRLGSGNVQSRCGSRPISKPLALSVKRQGAAICQRGRHWLWSMRLLSFHSVKPRAGSRQSCQFTVKRPFVSNRNSLSGTYVVLQASVN